MKEFDLIIIGGGAAGLLAASLASKGGAKVLLLEKMEKVGRKIRITGKGRCNLTNNKERDFFLSKVKAGADFISSSFSMFDNFALMDYFEEIGLPLSVEQGGRVYPKSGDAWDVVKVLERECTRNGAKISCRSEVKSLIINNGICSGVTLTDGREIFSSSVLIATGGVSYSGTGSTGDGYQFAYDAGHKIIPVMPSLVPFEVGKPFTPSLVGLILKNIKLSLIINGEEIASEVGEVEFFRFGIGGGAVFRLSREAVEGLYSGKEVDFSIDTKPGLSITKLEGRVKRELEQKPTLTLNELLVKLLPAKLSNVIIDDLRLNRNIRVTQMSDSLILEVLTEIKNIILPVYDHRGFKEAVITAGGIDTSEINPNTMESKKIKSLYFAGEVLDIDADTGGYNLQLAFTSGYCAAKAIISNIKTG